MAASAMNAIQAQPPSGHPGPDPTESLPARILRRMNESGGFPALDHSVARIVEALEIGEEDTSPLVEAVLADVSLTQKVLRLANSAMYAPIGGSVSTVSHAMKVLGFEAVGHLALGVKLIGSLGQMRPDSRSAERELAQSLVAGSVAGSVVAQTAVKNGEMGMVCTLLHRLGQLLTAFYLPDEWARIQGAVEAGEDEKEAARAVLGMSLDELGTYIAGQWRLPARIVATLGDTTPPGESEEDAWLHALTEPGDLVAAVGAATDEATAEPLLAGILLEEKTAPAQSAAAAAPSRVPTSAAAAVPAPASAPAQTKVSRLQAGIAALRQAVAGQEDRRGIEQAALATVFDGLQLSRAAILLLDAQRRAYRVSACLRERESDRLAEVSIPSGAGADLVHLALARKLDVYIDNPRDESEPMGLVFGQQREDVKLTREELGLLAELRDLLRRRLHADA